VATFLADKSALARRQTRTEVREALDPLLLAGEVATCGIVDLEMLYSATSPATYKALADALRGMPRVPLDENAVEHRAVPLPDLLVAACAENSGLIVVHYDADFERIAELTGQTVQWIVPRGSVA
jgi:predicted nucleic acid-binding protein